MATSASQANHGEQRVRENINGKGMARELYLAALEGSTEEVLSFGSNWWEQATPMGNNVLHVHVGKPLGKTGNKGKIVNVKFIEKVLNHDVGYSLLWQGNADGDAPLHVAARFGHADAVEELLDRARVVSRDEMTRMLRVTNKKKDTALHEAARGGYVDVVEGLVEADPGFVHEPNEAGETPLYLAAERGSTALVAKIIDTCAPSAVAYGHKGPCGRTALHVAVQLGTPEMIQKILEKDSSLIRVQDNEGLTPLHCASVQTNTQHLQVLLNHDTETESAVYIQDTKGRTALHVATLEYNLTGIKNLIASCPDCIEVVDHKGQNVVHYAAKLACFTKLKRFLEVGHFDKLINKKDVDGNTPLHLLAASLPSMTSHFCVASGEWIVEDQLFDLKAFNNQNLTAGDILASNDILHKDRIRTLVVRALGRGNRMNEFGRNVDVEIARNAGEVTEKRVLALKKAAESHLVVAALIATVSFAAGFTMPGGLNQNQGPNLGMAVLTEKSSFKAFLVSDAIAFTCSSLAILCYFKLANMHGRFYVELLSVSAVMLSSLSMGALMIAFVTGVHVVVSPSPGLISAVLAISFIFFVFYVTLLIGAFRGGISYLLKCKRRVPRL